METQHAAPEQPGASEQRDLRHGKPRLVIFANRYAGTLSRLRQEKSIADYARDAGFEPEVIFTRSSAHLRRLLREQVVGKLERVAVAGGDGTIHHAVQELARTGVVLGVLPQGTANNFATALRLPRDLPSAFRVIADGEVREVDLGEVEGEYFTEGAGIGIFADTLALAACHQRTKSWVRTARVLARLLVLNKTYRITLEIDGRRYADEAFNVTVANSSVVGLNIPIAPQARLTDHTLDIVVINPLTRREMLAYFKAIRAQTHAQLPKVQMLKGREIRISTRSGAVVHVDDRAEKRTPVTIQSVQRGLRVMVDRL